jgi:hypothetical protein
VCSTATLALPPRLCASATTPIVRVDGRAAVASAGRASSCSSDSVTRAWFAGSASATVLCPNPRRLPAPAGSARVVYELCDRGFADATRYIGPPALPLQALCGTVAARAPVCTRRVVHGAGVHSAAAGVGSRSPRSPAAATSATPLATELAGGPARTSLLFTSNHSLHTHQTSTHPIATDSTVGRCHARRKRIVANTWHDVVVEQRNRLRGHRRWDRPRQRERRLRPLPRRIRTRASGSGHSAATCWDDAPPRSTEAGCGDGQRAAPQSARALLLHRPSRRLERRPPAGRCGHARRTRVADHAEPGDCRRQRLQSRRLRQRHAERRQQYASKQARISGQLPRRILGVVDQGEVVQERRHRGATDVAASIGTDTYRNSRSDCEPLMGSTVVRDMLHYTPPAPA